MKNAKKAFRQIFFTFCACFAMFVLTLALAFSTQLHSVNTENTVSNIPYIEPSGENLGIFLKFEGGNSEFFYFDSEKNRISVILLENNTESEDIADYGYNVSAEIKADYEFLAQFIDRFCGIDLVSDKKTMHYTGVQVTDILSRTTDKDKIRNIISAVFGKIAKLGFSSQDLVYIINNTDNNLSFPKGYNAATVLSDLANNVYFIN